MTGRAIDQILPYPSNPRIHEPYVKDARKYLEIAEGKNGPIPKPVSFDYIWGNALKHLTKLAPDLRIINLETSITSSEDFWRKGINYRMNPRNIPCITFAKIDCCSLANNHILDWSYSGLRETLENLNRVGVRYAGAGNNIEEATSPAIMQVSTKGRLLVFSFGSPSSGVSPDWAATAKMPGVNFTDEQSPNKVQRIRAMVEGVKRENDLIIVSIHWGPNWGYEVSEEQRMFAHRLIDEAGVDLIHGHSSHHPKGIEVYNNRVILYGCGDFLNDYEGIASYESFRGDLGLMYFASLEEKTGELSSLRMVPTQIKHFRVNDASMQDQQWLRQVLDRECEKLGCHVEFSQGLLALEWFRKRA